MSPGRQHTIPRFYLDRFLSPGFVYRRGADAPRATKNGHDVAVQRDYYGKVVPGGGSPDDYNSITEDVGAPVFKQLIENPGSIASSEWEILSYLLANLAVRTPAAVGDLTSALLDLSEQVNDHAAKMQEKIRDALESGSDLSEFPTTNPHDDSPSQTLEETNTFIERLKMPGGYRSMILMDAVPEIAEGIQRMLFLIKEAPAGHHFVTSDRPLLLRSRTNSSTFGAGWLNPDAMGSIALCPEKFLLMFYHDEPGILEQPASPDEVAGLNSDTLMYAASEVYSFTETLENADWMGT